MFCLSTPKLFLRTPIREQFSWEVKRRVKVYPFSYSGLAEERLETEKLPLKGWFLIKAALNNASSFFYQSR
jgi:hypothetical protein